MTLQEVLNQIPEEAKVKRVPSVVKLAEEGIPALADQLGEDTSVVIYTNGYVVYQCGNRTTVFPIQVCRDYEYTTVIEKQRIPFEKFVDQPWQVRAFMVGKDRLVHYQNNRKESRTVSVNAYDSEVRWEALSDCGLYDPLRMLVEEEEKREEIELLYKHLEKLTGRQREILMLCVVKGKTHEEAARMLGTSRQTITDSLKKSLARLRKLYGLDENCGGRNCFCRRGQ